MAKLESILKSEIQRLAKREVRAVSIPLKREVRSLRLTLSKLSKTVSALERFAKEAAKEAKPKLQASPEEVAASRLTGPRIRSLRKRIGLSQRELGTLIGASLNAVALWESGKFRPRGEKKTALVALKKLGKREARRLLEEKEGPPTESSGNGSRAKGKQKMTAGKTARRRRRSIRRKTKKVRGRS